MSVAEVPLAVQRFQQSRKALGSEAVITLVSDDETASHGLFEKLWHQIETFEAKFSRFKTDSELSHVNQNAGERTQVSPEFVALLKTSKRLSAATDGLYNPFVLPSLQSAGYKGSWPTVDLFDPALSYTGRQLADSKLLELGDDWVMIPADSALDFGGIGKGYLLDQLAVAITDGITGYWISLGGDIICGGRDLEGKSWKIGIQKAETAEKAADIANKNGKPQAIATSGITKRRGENWHHIIDPRTALPAKTDMLTATVSVATATDADVFAKCLVIVGSAGAEAFITEHNITSAVLQYTDSEGAVQLRVIGNAEAITT
jgi:thiamine biosynthesis lipoprotein